MSSQEGCLSNETIAVGQSMQFIAYTIILPLYISMGLIGNIILLVAFHRQSKIEKAYRYQVFQTVGKTAEIALFGAFQVGTTWLYVGGGGKRAGWFASSAFLKWIYWNLCTWGHMHLIMSTLLLSVAMAADRLFALAQPMRYNKINHKKHQAIAASICFILPALSSPSYAFYSTFAWKDDHYEVGYDVVFITSTYSTLCSIITVAIRVSGILALIVLNILMVVMFRKRRQQIAKMTNMNEKNASNKAADRTLFLLNFSQSVMMLANQLPHVTMNAAFVTSTYLSCYSDIAPPFADMCIFITDAIDLAVVMAINKTMRRAVFNAIRCGEGQVTPATGAAGK